MEEVCFLPRQGPAFHLCSGSHLLLLYLLYFQIFLSTDFFFAVFILSQILSILKQPSVDLILLSTACFSFTARLIKKTVCTHCFLPISHHLLHCNHISPISNRTVLVTVTNDIFFFFFFLTRPRVCFWPFICLISQHYLMSLAVFSIALQCLIPGFASVVPFARGPLLLVAQCWHSLGLCLFFFFFHPRAFTPFLCLCWAFLYWQLPRIFLLSSRPICLSAG